MGLYKGKEAFSMAAIKEEIAPPLKGFVRLGDGRVIPTTMEEVAKGIGPSADNRSD